MPSKASSIKQKKGGEVDRVYSLLRNWIVNCRFRPGDFLPEVEVGAQCKTSRTPVREACNRLAEEKWLSKIQNKGYIVTPISLQDISEIYQYRKLLECFAVERAARVISPEEILALENLIAVESRPNAKMSEIVGANYAFHTGLGKLARNQRVFDQLKITLDYVHRLDLLSTQSDARWVPHQDIMVALRTRDVNGARRAMEIHVDQSRDRMFHVFFRGEMPIMHEP